MRSASINAVFGRFSQKLIGGDQVQAMQRKKRVHVAYCGDFFRGIGPPTSMRNLASLLAKDFEVSTTKQLARSGISVEQAEGDTTTSVVSRTRMFLKAAPFERFIREIRFFYLVCQFNLSVLWNLYKRRADVIITQPFYFLPVPRLTPCLIYIRRGNVPIGTVCSAGILHRYIESRFYKHSRYKLIYLVDQTDESRKYLRIPNHFDLSSHQLVPVRQDPRLIFVGTWNKRKGGDRLLGALANLPIGKNVFVFGQLGDDLDLNNRLAEANFNYMGLTDRPYNQISIGDVFISLSRLEGLQRSMIEALLQGALVVAARRPDSESIEAGAGVFLFDWTDAEFDRSCANLSALLDSLCNLSASERERLGLANRQHAQFLFGEETIRQQWRKCLLDL